jgi:hypothetical protein
MSLGLDLTQLSNGGSPTPALAANAVTIIGNFPTTATGHDGNFHVGLVPVPEPTTAVLGGLGMLALLSRRRRPARG